MKIALCPFCGKTACNRGVGQAPSREGAAMKTPNLKKVLPWKPKPLPRWVKPGARITFDCVVALVVPGYGAVVRCPSGLLVSVPEDGCSKTWFRAPARKGKR
jgi:hypothetical protein